MTGGQSAHAVWAIEGPNMRDQFAFYVGTGFQSFLVEAQTNAGYIQMALYASAFIRATRIFQFWTPHVACNNILFKSSYR